MGIRFRCHQCGHELHVKDFQGGKRSRCPECETKFRIPVESAEYSIPLDASQPGDSTVASSSQATSSAQSTSSAQTTSSAKVALTGVATDTLPAKSVLADSSPSDAEPEVGAQDDAPQELDHVSESAAPVSPQAILEAPGATWYVRPPAGGQYGPAPANIFCEWLTENRVTRDSLVWRDGWPQWLVAGEVFADYFGPALPPTSPVTSPVTSPAAFIANAVPLVSSTATATSVAEQMAAPNFVAPTSLSDRALAARKRQRKKNYMIMIGVLAAISVGLVIALVVVLMQNS
ncbi:MAG: DUF4339 domain-containing protein [Pirellulaceae bacterium]|nr:DUF4339 domain-containing protein [Pirellulaceae bacterium]